MPRRRPDPRVVELLEDMLAEARAGELTGLFAVYTTPDGAHGGAWATDDLNDLLFHVRTEAIGARVEVACPAGKETKLQ